MGGKAFSVAAAEGEPTLNISRLTREQYVQLKDIYLARFKEYFRGAEVATFIEAPEKTEYGDIDFIVASDELAHIPHMADRTGARAFICYGPGKCTLGVPTDGTKYPKPAVLYREVNVIHRGALSAHFTDEEYAQVDVEIIPTEVFEWRKFFGSYGDMSTLLGHILNNLGLSFKNEGLSLRMKELDDIKPVEYQRIGPRDGHVHLSYDPSKVMRFLGLSEGKYIQGFDTMNELFTWLGECRLLSADAIRTKRDDAKGRNRERLRPVYSQFVNEWLPTHVAQTRELKLGRVSWDGGDSNTQTLDKCRLDIVQEALDFFDKRSEYEAKHGALVRRIKNATAVHLLTPIIAERTELEYKAFSRMVVAFARFVAVTEEGEMRIVETPRTDEKQELYRLLAADGKTLANPDAVGAWVKENWEEQ